VERESSLFEAKDCRPFSRHKRGDFNRLKDLPNALKKELKKPTFHQFIARPICPPFQHKPQRDEEASVFEKEMWVWSLCRLHCLMFLRL
jgi:hypothetical protein